MKSRSVVAILLAGLLSPVASFACGGAVGWAQPSEQSAAITIDQVISDSSRSGLTIKKDEMQSRCSSDADYTVIDTQSGIQIASLPTSLQSVKENDGRFLQARLAQVLQTPRNQLIALAQSSRIFMDDIDGLKEDLGVSAYAPSAYPIEMRIKNNGQDYLMFVTVEGICSPQINSSSHNINDQFYMKTIEYIPGRTDYSATTIYQAGDFKKALLKDTKTMDKLKETAALNAKYCRNNEYGKQAMWKEISERLNKNQAGLSPVARMKKTKGSITAAHMLNSNRIAITIDNSQVEFGGSVAEMVEIQKILTAKNIKTDKRGKLNWEGQIEMEVITEQNREIPESLRE